MTYKIWEKWTNLGIERDNSQVKPLCAATPRPTQF